MQTLCQSRMQVPAANHWAMGQLRMPPSQHRKWAHRMVSGLKLPALPTYICPYFDHVP